MTAAQADRQLIEAAQVSLPAQARVTPMMRQWLEAKAKEPQAILLFRMGDFYELFADDAVHAADLLDLTLTTRDRDKGKDSAIAMAGFPHHAAAAYIARLVQAGCKVAVCDQLEDPALARGIVKRDITRLVTPGMVLEDESLDARANNYLVGIAETGPHYGVAALDLSTGSFMACVVEGENALVDEVLRLAPGEIVIPEKTELDELLLEKLQHRGPENAPRRLEARKEPTGHKKMFQELSGALDPLINEPEQRPARRAAALCLSYVLNTQGTIPTHVQSPGMYSTERLLLIDETTRQHLNLVGPAGRLREPGTLASVMDKALTAAGSRYLLRSLLAPSTEMAMLEKRLDRVQALVDDPGLRQNIRDQLTGIYDLERLTARVASGRAGPRDLGQLGRSLQRLPLLVLQLKQSETPSIQEIADSIDLLEDLASVLERALVDEPPLGLVSGTIFRSGFDDVLDAHQNLSTGGRDEIAALEEREKKNTGITNLKVKFTRVFGYYIEVTRPNLSKVPEHYQRKQTVANGERFIVEELSRLEEKIAGAEQKRAAREAELFQELVRLVGNETSRILKTAEYVSTIDMSAAFAEVSDQGRFVRPVLLPKEDQRLAIEAGRHPIVESALRAQGEPFVPGDIELSSDDRQVVLVTGPNMAGKSTMMRQVALIQVLAQSGCFVPATAATLSICDRIFTRVGASDDLAAGQSTFMVEMTEAAHILKNATPYSLLLLDEIGRGTSTFDGLSLAWAVAEFIHEEIGARTLFATHYHELCELADHLNRVKNVHVVVKEWNDEIIFTRTIAEGGAERSYGIQVARLAGLPASVLSRAREVLAELEGDNLNPASEEAPRVPTSRRWKRGVTDEQMDLFGGRKSVEPEKNPFQDVMDRLDGLDIQRLTPLQALNELDELVRGAKRAIRKQEKAKKSSDRES
jgi:DNA mismatch repair protein MutS